MPLSLLEGVVVLLVAGVGFGFSEGMPSRSLAEFELPEDITAKMVILQRISKLNCTN